MDTDVDQWAATLLFLVNKDAPARNSSPTERLGSSKVNLAHVSGLDVFTHESTRTTKSALQSDLEDLS